MAVMKGITKAKDNKCQQGFGLIEVMIAAVIGMSIVAAITKFMAGSLKSSAVATDIVTWNNLAQRAQAVLADHGSCLSTVSTMSNYTPTGFANASSVAVQIRSQAGSVIMGPPFPKKIGKDLVVNNVVATPFPNGGGNFFVRIDLDGTLKTTNAPPANANYIPPTALDSPFPQKATFSSYIVSVSFTGGPGNIKCAPKDVAELQTQVETVASNLQTQSTNLQTQNTSLQTQLAALQNQVNTMAAQLAALQSAPIPRGPYPYSDAGFYWRKTNGNTDGPLCILKNLYTHDCSCPSGSSEVTNHFTSLFNQWTASHYCRWN